MKTLNIIGCGKLGNTLAKLWSDKQSLKIQAICNRSIDSTQQAVQLVGSGQPIKDIRELPPADFTLISTPDSAIANVCQSLVNENKLTKETVVFHCSGSLTSSILELAHQFGCHTASVHPVHSFAAPEVSTLSFAKTVCTIEGDADAVTQLEQLFSNIDAIPVAIKPESKMIYHIGLVFASNYLVSLVEASLRLFDSAGIDRATALNCIKPIVNNTTDNIINLGTAKALTGPIARQDLLTLENHLAALKTQQIDKNIVALYQSLGKIAIQLTAENKPIAQELYNMFEVDVTS